MQYALFNVSPSCRRLTLFFAGWGMDAVPFRPLIGTAPVAVVWNYTDLATPLPLPKSQDAEIRIVAWSMGVWAASQLMQGQSVREAVAVNGTPWPIDGDRGIPPAVFDATLEGFGETGLARFRRRMCGNASALREFMETAPRRTVEDLGLELRSLGAAIRSRPAADFVWTRAIVCTEDRIFPPAGQLRAFPRAECRKGAHWDRALFADLLNGEPA